MKKMFLVIGLFVLSTPTVALEYQAVKLSTWKGTESILGEEFLAASEAVVDYVASLPHPTDSLKPMRFDCEAKIRRARQWVNTTSGGGSSATGFESLDFYTVYDIRNCTARPE